MALPLHAGLDFGTTNSTLALAGRNSPPRLLALEGDHRTIPPALFFSLEDGQTYFGRAAVAEYVDGAEGRFMRALKSILGTSLMEETTQVGRERMSFVELIGRFLRRLQARLADEMGETPEAIVLGRPVRFVDEDDEADRLAESQLAQAARSEGFRHVEFQLEPIAAALDHERSVTGEELALVVDIGGGTSDFSVVRLSPRGAERFDRQEDILSTAGVHVGGTDFDKALSIAAMMPLLGLGSSTADGKRNMPVWYYNDLATWHRVNTLYTPKTLRDVRALAKEAAEPEKLQRLEHVLRARSGHRLAGAVETAKIALSDRPETTIRFADPDVPLERTVTQNELAAAGRPLVARIEGAIDEALKRAGLPADAVDTVILTGGATRMPIVEEAAIRRFPQARIARPDAFGSVGMGLAVDAARRFA